MYKYAVLTSMALALLALIEEEMVYLTIGEVAEKCGIHPVTLRAWQRRYGLLSPKRTEGGHRQFDEHDLSRIEEIKRLIDSGIAVSRVRELIDDRNDMLDDWQLRQEALKKVVLEIKPAKLSEALISLRREFSMETLIDNIFIPLRKRLRTQPGLNRHICSYFDGTLVHFAARSISDARKKAGKEALLIGWGIDDMTGLWLEACRLTYQGWNIFMLKDSFEHPRPELFPEQHIFLWTGKKLSFQQQQQYAQWLEQGYSVSLHPVMH